MVFRETRERSAGTHTSPFIALTRSKRGDGSIAMAIFAAAVVNGWLAVTAGGGRASASPPSLPGVLRAWGGGLSPPFREKTDLT